ncbi:MAG: hypothetical protein K2X49_14835 [Acetobacteraceae bacterium]|nr:hypothetical protein [Acetobacteraceae bacterium]
MPLPRLLPLLLALAACATPAPPPAAPEAVATAASAPAAAGDPLPPLALAPRARWTRIRIDPRSGIAAAYRASPVLPGPDGTQRRWIVANLAEPIRLPETGGRAASAAFLADYRCDRHAWQPIEILWFARRDAQAEVLRERPRDGAERRVQEGTLIDVFLDAACGSRAQPR